MPKKTAPAGRPRHELLYRDPRGLKPYERNAKTHPADQVRRIRASMDRFGNNAPILLRDDETTIGAGHGRWEAALLDPPLPEVPTIVLRGLTEAEWRAYVIADNKLAELGGWDEELFAAEVSEILAAGADLADVMGLDQADLDALGASQPDLSGGAAPGAGGPTFNYQEQYGVIVVCAGEAEQQAVYERLTAEGLDCKVVCT